MGESIVQLRERMLREAILEVLRSLADPSGQEDVSVVARGLVRDVVVEGERVRVELVLGSRLRPFAARLVTDVHSRVASLPEVAAVDVDVIGDETFRSPTKGDRRCAS